MQDVGIPRTEDPKTFQALFKIHLFLIVKKYHHIASLTAYAPNTGTFSLTS